MNFDDVPHVDDYYVSTEQHLLDHRWITEMMLETPWSAHRTHETIVDALKNSICFGLYWHRVTGDRDLQIGIARVISDLATYSLISDVIIDPKFRGRGLGKFLLAQILRHPSVAPTVCVLRTNTATAFYEKFGFTPVAAMRKLPEQAERGILPG